jgi:isoprenylcysteine carboxyl methyltransferase (ICMT) family protein
MHDRPAIFAFAFLLAIAGIVLRWYAIVTLGRFFSMRVQTTSDQQVVESGPYRFVRHPSYTGGANDSARRASDVDQRFVCFVKHEVADWHWESEAPRVGPTTEVRIGAGTR